MGSEEEAIEAVRAILSYLPPNNLDDPVLMDSSEPSVNATDVIPAESSQAYDIHDVIEAVVDGGSFFEVQQAYAMNAVVGFGRLNGGSIGVVASQPSVMAGTMTIDSSDKISRFVRLCDASTSQSSHSRTSRATSPAWTRSTGASSATVPK